MKIVLFALVVAVLHFAPGQSAQADETYALSFVNKDRRLGNVFYSFIYEKDIFVTKDSKEDMIFSHNADEEGIYKGEKVAVWALADAKGNILIRAFFEKLPKSSIDTATGIYFAYFPKWKAECEAAKQDPALGRYLPDWGVAKFIRSRGGFPSSLLTLRGCDGEKYYGVKRTPNFLLGGHKR